MDTHNKLGVAVLVALLGAFVAVFADVTPNPNAAFLLAGVLIGGGSATSFCLRK